ncbi:MAG: DEAD/DEAH box helicase family protein [Bacteroides sp.]|nr:DEAD/DEAH box helicase family protein [Bacteroides sp.]MCM1094885.1 DEAD/DEAH box helicase family protein [Terasakiella sp.]
MSPRKSVRRPGGAEPKLGNALLLNRYLLSLFGAPSLEAFGAYLKDPMLEGYDQDNVSLFYKAIVARPIPDPELTPERLLQYDRNIYRHTEVISSRRSRPVRWKYFQYLALLFTEIYLDRYFNSRQKLLGDIQKYRREVYDKDPATWHEMSEYTASDLNKLAYWCATGSGKTLLMHVNILQFRHYCPDNTRIGRTILVTPNAGLTRQHADEFELSDIPARAFSKNTVAQIQDSACIDIIEITKLSEKDGDKTVAVDSFERHNLVLVDEGHRGSSGDTWKIMRDRLAADGFAFEYSATFGQAVSSQSSDARKKSMLDEYGRAIILDYSYSHFYHDGYGKDYHILNIGDADRGFAIGKYLTACLLSFYEQIRLYLDRPGDFKPFMIEKPLAVFVGSTVSSASNAWKQEMSDIVYLLTFFRQFISRSRESIDIIDALLNGTDGLIDKNNEPIFTRSLRYLRTRHADADAIYHDILRLVFNCDTAGATLHLDHLKGSDGEIGLRIGNAPYFGIINVGDSAAIISRCAQAGMSTMPMDYSERSLFASINSKDSSLNMLIGSKKFSEGWSSWRVSTMGLLNVGRSEGSQIMQLFGRGVRLKGYGFSLKRSTALDSSVAPDAIPQHINVVETLNIFGIRADYMELFKMLLGEEGLPANDNSFREYIVPVVLDAGISGRKLKYPRIKDGKDFRRQKDAVNLDTAGIGNHIITLDCYPRVLAMHSGMPHAAGTAERHTGVFTPQHLQFIDWREVFFSIEDFKKERGWTNLSFSPHRLKAIAHDTSWYRLLIPAYDLKFNDYSRCVTLWQDTVTALLKLYVERAYRIAMQKFIADNMEVGILDASHPDFIQAYRIRYHRDLDYLIDGLDNVKAAIDNPTFAKTINISNSEDFKALYISRHLYRPLLYINPDAFNVDGTGPRISIEPAALNTGECAFVNDLQRYYDSNPGFFADKQLYLLRNQSRKGVGFFEVAGFYPDFIMWLVVGERQYITFVDPKGISHLRSFSDDKIQLYKKIRTVIEPSLNDPNITLNSFIISVTPLSRVSHWTELAGKDSGSMSLCDVFNDHHIYFQTEQSHLYIGKMFEAILK